MRAGADSIVSEEINFDLVDLMDKIARGEESPAPLLGSRCCPARVQ
jgi:hypothetical protein